MNAENYIRNMSAVFGCKKEGRRRASAQLLLPWVDEMPNTYTHDVRTVNTERWVIDGYLMERAFASRQSPQMSLDKTTPNQPMAVKRTGPPERLKRSKTLVVKGLAFDKRRANQPVSFGPSGSIGHRHVHENHHVHVTVNIDP